MTKKDLKFGNVVKLRNGKLCLIHPVFNCGSTNIQKYLGGAKEIDIKFRVLKDGSYETSYDRYKDDLTHVSDSYYDIIEVYEDFTLTKLLRERKEFSATEKAIIAELFKNYKYLVRDKDGLLSVFTDKPVKVDIYGIWDCATDYGMGLDAFSHLFQSIKWEDNEPYFIGD